MALTRIKVKQLNNEMKIVDKQTGIADKNPVVYYGDEDLPLSDDDVVSGRAKYLGRGFTAFEKYCPL